ncbi:hypothetical protein ASG99_12380 [Bacillus sp. Soil768D1]|nr:hypothetical protein ASG99_12380 [Bacillus sp. Soil768D1]
MGDIYATFYNSRNANIHRSVILIYEVLKRRYGKYFVPKMFNQGAVNANLVKKFGEFDNFDYEVYENVLSKIIKDEMSVEEILNLVFVQKEMRNKKKVLNQIRNNFYQDGWIKK